MNKCFMMILLPQQTWYSSTVSKLDFQNLNMFTFDTSNFQAILLVASYVALSYNDLCPFPKVKIQCYNYADKANTRSFSSFLFLKATVSLIYQLSDNIKSKQLENFTNPLKSIHFNFHKVGHLLFFTCIII